MRISMTTALLIGVVGTIGGIMYGTIDPTIPSAPTVERVHGYGAELVVVEDLTYRQAVAVADAVQLSGGDVVCVTRFDGKAQVWARVPREKEPGWEIYWQQSLKGAKEGLR